MQSFTIKDETIHFHLWAPKLKTVDVVDRDGQLLIGLQKSGAGVFEGACKAKLPLNYFFVADGRRLPDPCSAFLPKDIHGPSEISVSGFGWSDQDWTGIDRSDLLIYELHVGTFSQDGTYEGCRRQLDYLCDLGITAVELLPLAQCPGRWNWGYDAVGLFAPNSKYGSADDLKRLIDDCHRRGLSVIHDVVYNHVGPEGNYLGAYGQYFSAKRGTPWGSAFDFDGPNQDRARGLVVDNAIYWLKEFHFDGLRLDAIHYMFDDNEYSIQQEICDRVRDFERDAGRTIHLIGEANIYDHGLIVGDQRNLYSAIWADDLMHAVYSLAETEAHLTPRKYVGATDVQEALQNGYLYEGPVMKRVTSSDRAATHGDTLAEREYLNWLIIALQTHDSVGNHAQGKRLHHLAGLEFQLAAAPLFWLYPAIPMMFMGEEFAAESPFMFFADFLDEKLRRNVNRGRKQEFPNHDWTDAIEPSDERAFLDCKLELPSGEHRVLDWYRGLIEQRKKWKQAGLLNPANMTVDCDVERGLFGFSYRTGDQNAFVIACLGPASSAETMVDIGVAGVVEMDSQSQCVGEKADEKCALRPNQTLIGRGVVTI